ncbi:MAG: hypothetical protein HC836_31640 [Richelia sp. RM2_1_2]|nr:hypothetical protein [Richelia sp. RM2_1_2]
MEVIKKGRKQKGWAREYKCTGEGNKDGGCGAELLISAKDIVITGYINGDYRDLGDTCYGFKCCECGVMTDINPSDIPDEIKNKLR